jgi:hypothetical protein
LLIISGTMGAGKTAVLGEASGILVMRQISHAAIDLDCLGLAHLPSTASNDEVIYGNLRSVYKNYAAIGVQRFLVGRALEDRAELKLRRDVIPPSSTVVCRLTASVEVMKQRVKMRESGISQQEYIARVVKLNVILDRGRLEDFTHHQRKSFVDRSCP